MSPLCGRGAGGLGKGVTLNLGAVNGGAAAGLGCWLGWESGHCWHCTGRDEELGWKSRPELGLPRPRTGEPRDGTCCLRAPAAYLSLGPGTLGKLSQTCLVPGQDTSGGSPSQAPQGFTPAEGAEPECGRVGVCMSVDPERHTLTHTHSHARTHAGPSAAPPRTFTPKAGPPGPAPRAKSLQMASH